MKSTYLLGVLAHGLRARARQVPAAGVAARQWGEGGGGFGGGFGGGWGGGGGSGGSECEWTDHCLGDPCESDVDCDGDLLCSRGECANSVAGPTVRPTTPTRTAPIRTTTVYVTIRPTEPSNPTCEWTGHCAGDPCETENDCDGDMICRSGKCGAPPTTIVTSTRRAPTTTRRMTNPPVVTTTRRVTNPPVVTTTRRVTVPPVVTRSTVRPQPTTTRGATTPACGDNPLACIGVSCSTDADCGFALIICKDGVCGL